MKKFLFIFSIFNFQFSIFSQPSLDSSNFPKAGISYNRFIAIGGNIGTSGANQLYDFSNSMVWLNDTLRYVTPVSTGFAANHPGSNSAMIQWGAITAIWYYSSDANAFWTSGATLFGDFGAGFTITHANHPSPYMDTLISNEYTYGHIETEISAIRFQNIYPGLDYQMISGKYIECDGYGTLYAPLDTFTNVLRVKYIEFKYDTAFINGVPDTAGAKHDTLYYYKYFAPEIRYPVVVANTNEFNELQWIEVLVMPDVLNGCTDANAENYNPIANQDDGTCIYCNQINYTITPDAAICSGNSVTLIATGATNYLWSTGETTSSVVVSPDSSETFSVLLNNQSYCWEQASVEVSVYDAAVAGFWATTIQGDTILFVNTSENATNYFWNFGDSTTSAEENPRHLYSSEGTKTVMLIASNQCSSDTFYFAINYVGEDEIQNSKFKIQIYPNPNNGKFNVQMSKYADVQIKLYNILGELVYSKVLTTNNEQLTTNIPDGIYFVQIQTDNNSVTQKIIKQ